MDTQVTRISKLSHNGSFRPWAVQLEAVLTASDEHDRFLRRRSTEGDVHESHAQLATSGRNAFSTTSFQYDFLQHPPPGNPSPTRTNDPLVDVPFKAISLTQGTAAPSRFFPYPHRPNQIASSSPQYACKLSHRGVRLSLSTGKRSFNLISDRASL
jgi:hypothetical protein